MRRKTPVVAVYIEKCDGKEVIFKNVTTREAKEIVAEYKRGAKRKDSACRIATVDKIDNAIDRWERWRGRRWKKI